MLSSKRNHRFHGNNDNSLSEVNINSIGNFYGEVNATNFNINNADANVTVSRLLIGDVLYSAELIVNGVTCSITTSANNQWKLTINSCNVIGTIEMNSLKVVNIRANPMTLSANVLLLVILI
ncbi:hypothetical protein [Rickettsia canadensis]|uniref:Uncharacterized protein n=1 Tax=Rickettsia canadensis str. CA410 TaxID=1105107 RepID=A0ABM5MS36_RICCA|nr:hypothetical protein [Rickettsia canadensis]AFB21315.1 hypothetical protein RCA_03780 [Rickettsia canadensis str. CA410]